MGDDRMSCDLTKTMILIEMLLSKTFLNPEIQWSGTTFNRDHFSSDNEAEQQTVDGVLKITANFNKSLIFLDFMKPMLKILNVISETMIKNCIRCVLGKSNIERCKISFIHESEDDTSTDAKVDDPKKSRLWEVTKYVDDDGITKKMTFSLKYCGLFKPIFDQSELKQMYTNQIEIIKLLIPEAVFNVLGDDAFSSERWVFDTYEEGLDLTLAADLIKACF
ncbi:unnamed protein product [Owenia fusiformis]|uniref:Uncharacterized protein n=1 Tax=Owenia fusiformis TaxID=6347 RepID=A0A8S4Q0I2_OWEFU|nr:unnamed protein product [Owenia fusiformis]